MFEMFMWGIDPYFTMLVLPALIFTLWAQFKVKSSFNKYSKERTTSGITGAQAAQEILRLEGLTDVRIEKVAGHLTDHYDPRDNTIRLSESVHDAATVAAVGVAAHEVGHAIQHAHGYVPMQIRSFIIPVTMLGSRLAVPLIFAGFLLDMTGLINFAILLFGAVVLFQLITLPVEFDASGRAVAALETNAMLTSYEIHSSKKVLTAAALTYVAALALALVQLISLIARSRR
jgi:hypothetical protein